MATEWDRAAGDYFRGVQMLDKYFREHLQGQLENLVLTERQKALKLVLLCGRSLLAGMAKIDSKVAAFRARAVLSRAAWEHLVEFETIRRSRGDEIARRYLAFAEIQAWRRAKDMLALKAKSHLALDKSDEVLQKYLDDTKAQSRIQAHLVKFWPKHTLGTAHKISSWYLGSLRDRAEALGAEYAHYYVDTYSIFSWSAHAGSAGVVGMSARFFQSLDAKTLLECFEHVIQMTRSFLEDVRLDRMEEQNILRIYQTVTGGSGQ